VKDSQKVYGEVRETKTLQSNFKNEGDKTIIKNELLKTNSRFKELSKNEQA
jgi:hypothetical protein